jgi:hypothetical protein
MDNAKQFAYYPVAILKSVDNFSDGAISVKFKTIACDSDRCSVILFNVKPNGDWLSIRYNDRENNVGLWEFHNGISEPQGIARRHSGAGVHAWQRSRASERSTEFGSVAGKQSRAPAAGRRQGRPLVENGQHKLLQRLCREPAAVKS